MHKRSRKVNEEWKSEEKRQMEMEKRRRGTRMKMEKQRRGSEEEAQEKQKSEWGWKCEEWRLVKKMRWQSCEKGGSKQVEMM